MAPYLTCKRRSFRDCAIIGAWNIQNCTHSVKLESSIWCWSTLKKVCTRLSRRLRKLNTGIAEALNLVHLHQHLLTLLTSKKPATRLFSKEKDSLCASATIVITKRSLRQVSVTTLGDHVVSNLWFKWVWTVANHAKWRSCQCSLQSFQATSVGIGLATLNWTDSQVTHKMIDLMVWCDWFPAQDKVLAYPLWCKPKQVYKTWQLTATFGAYEAGTPMDIVNRFSGFRSFRSMLGLHSALWLID